VRELEELANSQEGLGNMVGGGRDWGAPKAFDSSEKSLKS
jgi:hypothetical protein